MSAKTFDTILINTKRFFDELLTGILVSVTPFTASLIPAIFLASNLINVMLFHPMPAIVIAAAAEGIGVGSISIFFRAVQFNKRYTADKNQVSTLPAMIAYGIYLSAIIVTNALIECDTWMIAGIWQTQAIILSLSKALLSLLALSGALMIATNYAIATVKQSNKRKSAKSKRTKSKASKIKANQSEYICGTCGFVAKNQNALNGHMRKHSKVSKNGNGHSQEQVKV